MDQLVKLCETAKRKETILSTISEQGKLTAELQKRIDDTWDTTELEDIYLPYKPKRKTRAEAARQKGLEPLAVTLMLQRENNLEAKVGSFVKGDVKTIEDALKGARDIIAEQVNEDERARNAIRNQFSRQAVISAKVVKGKEEEAAKYRDYFEFSEPLKRCTSHRLLAIRRAESEGMLKVSISPDDEECIERLERQFVRSNNECGRQVAEAVQDAYKRLLKPSIETEFAAITKEKADEEAIRVFVENLRQLLLAPPLGKKRVLYDIDKLDQVVDVDRNSPAYAAGIRPRDIIEKIGRHKMDHSAEEFSSAYKRFITNTMQYRDPKTMFTDANGFKYCMFWDVFKYPQIADASQSSDYLPAFSYLYHS